MSAAEQPGMREQAGAREAAGDAERADDTPGRHAAKQAFVPVGDLFSGPPAESAPSPAGPLDGEEGVDEEEDMSAYFTSTFAQRRRGGESSCGV
ncbi:hypothetical protein [Streptomyces tsukubensis]|uniref:Uncharacterized protein n=1 Tax=Streptomyces tsukubensis TaxID=83656 RepID=A0A1V4A1S0_9ACTN|nr:hypothetical protein [Streptomyces tsukubensis]OON72543.1 hypothetical protein B1H18_29615 [Streptomyces tsukubensis]QFR93667.1 hypothetical protein GBW32_11945 [Streptomyces tsukubensis]